MYSLEKPTEDEKMWGLIAHISSFVAPIAGPIVVYLIQQEKSKFVKYHAMQSILINLALMVGFTVFTGVVSVISVVTCGIGSFLYLLIPLLMPLGLAPLYGAWMAWQGEWKGYPMLEQYGREGNS